MGPPFWVGCPAAGDWEEPLQDPPCPPCCLLGEGGGALCSLWRLWVHTEPALLVCPRPMAPSLSRPQASFPGTHLPCFPFQPLGFCACLR